jgi:uncharacterized protein
MKHNIPVDNLFKYVNDCREKLLINRQNRTHPQKDTKILCDWNGLTIAALAKLARIADNPQILTLATNAAEFILQNLCDLDYQLMHSYYDNAKIPAFLDDYAFILWGLLELYKTTFNFTYLNNAINIADKMIDLYYDNNNGGFYFSGESNEKLVTKSKPIYDGAIPSGNSVATYCLAQLSEYTMNKNYHEIAESTLNAFSEAVKTSPTGFSQYLQAAMWIIYPNKQIVIAGDLDNSIAQNIINTINSYYIPDSILIHNPTDNSHPIKQLLPFLNQQNQINNKPTVYICNNYSCRKPITDLMELKAYLDNFVNCANGT